MRPRRDTDGDPPAASPAARAAPPWSLWLVLVLAVVVRLGFDAANPRPLVSDQADYDRIAWTIATRGVYEDEGAPTAYRPPGYTFFVAAIYRVAGRNPDVVRAVQAVLDAGTALLLFALLRRRSPRAAWVGATIWAILPSAVAYSGLLLSETLFAFLAALLAARLDGAGARSGIERLATGLLLGALILVKPAAFLLLAALPFGPTLWGATLRQRAPVILGALLLVAPWMARNAIVLGVPTLTTSVGSNMLIGNNPNATGGYASDVPSAMRPASDDEVEGSAQSARAAIEYAEGHPARFAALVPLRWAHLVMGEAELSVTRFAPDPTDPSSAFREKVRALPSGLVLALWVPFAALLAAGTAGFLARPGGETGALFGLIVAAWLLVHGATIGGSRYHASWMPFLVLYASEFVVAPRDAWTSLGTGRRALALAVIAACVAVWAGEAAVYWLRA